MWVHMSTLQQQVQVIRCEPLLHLRGLADFCHNKAKNTVPRENPALVKNYLTNILVNLAVFYQAGQ